MECLRIPNNSKTKKPKNEKTPFYFFMMEKKAEWEEAGEWSPKSSVEDLVHAVFPLWKSMKEIDPKFMEPYVELHRVWKREKVRDLKHKYDSLGRSLADVEKEIARHRKKIYDMELEVEETVLQSRESSCVGSSLYYVASFNYLCKTDEGFYIPCEASVVEFNLERGITGCWHKFLSPLDSIPEGYQYKCIRFARDTHNLCKNFEGYETDYSKILKELETFISKGKTSRKLPPIYVMPDHVEAAECITQFIMDKAGEPNSLSLRVFTLPLLLFHLHNACPCYPWPTECLADYAMEKDLYSYHHYIGCEFHEALQNSTHCTLSKAKRLVFTVCGECCPLLEIELVPGFHEPPDQDASSPISLAVKKEMSQMSHVREEGGRINRFVPAVCGVSIMPEDSEDSDCDISSSDVLSRSSTSFPKLPPVPNNYSENIFFNLGTAITRM